MAARSWQGIQKNLKAITCVAIRQTLIFDKIQKSTNGSIFMQPYGNIISLDLRAVTNVHHNPFSVATATSSALLNKCAIPHMQ